MLQELSSSVLRHVYGHIPYFLSELFRLARLLHLVVCFPYLWLLRVFRPSYLTSVTANPVILLTEIWSSHVYMIHVLLDLGFRYTPVQGSHLILFDNYLFVLYALDERAYLISCIRQRLSWYRYTHFSSQLEGFWDYLSSISHITTLGYSLLLRLPTRIPSHTTLM
jgi:hypothetical protein